MSLKESTTCDSTRYANPPEWLVLRRHTNEMEKPSEFVYKREINFVVSLEKVYSA